MAITEGQTSGTALQTTVDGEAIAYRSTVAGRLPITAICVSVDAASAVAATVRLPQLHGATAETGAIVPVGTREYFRIGMAGITDVFIGGLAGVATVAWWGVSDVTN